MEKGPWHPTWLAPYIVTVETAVIVMLVGFYATGWQDLVTQAQLANYRFPYLPAEQTIRAHITKSEATLEKVIVALEQLNDRLSSETAAANLRLTLLERQAKLQKE